MPTATAFPTSGRTALDTPTPAQSLLTCSRRSADVGFRACSSRTSRIGCSAGLRDELQRDAIDAIAQVGRGWPVVEDMPEVASTSTAVDLVAHHAVAAVSLVFDSTGQRIVETRPTGPAFELHFRHEQGLITGYAPEGARTLLMQQCAASGHLGAVLAHDLILLGCEDLAPLGFAVGDRILFHDFPRCYLIASG